MALQVEVKGVVWSPSPAHPPQWPQQASWPLFHIPPAARCPQCLGGAGKETQVQTLLGAWSEHGVMREDETPGGQGHDHPCVQRGTTSPRGSSHCECTTTDPPFAGIVWCEACEPQPESRDVRTPCYAPCPLHGTPGEKVSETCKGCVICAPGQSCRGWAKEPVRAMSHHIKETNVNLCLGRRCHSFCLTQAERSQGVGCWAKQQMKIQQQIK